jgi:hypothetical protein
MPSGSLGWCRIEFIQRISFRRGGQHGSFLMLTRSSDSQLLHLVNQGRAGYPQASSSAVSATNNPARVAQHLKNLVTLLLLSGAARSFSTPPLIP